MNSTAATPILTTGFEELYSFEPSAGRVRLLDQRMRSRLAESFRYILERGIIDFGTPTLYLRR